MTIPRDPNQTLAKSIDSLFEDLAANCSCEAFPGHDLDHLHLSFEFADGGEFELTWSWSEGLQGLDPLTLDFSEDEIWDRVCKYADKIEAGWRDEIGNELYARDIAETERSLMGRI